LRELIDELFKAVIQACRARFIGGERGDDALALFEFALLLENLRRFLLQEMQIPAFDKQSLLSAVDDLWRRADMDDTLAIIRRVLSAGDELMEPLMKLAVCAIEQIQSSAAVGAGVVDEITVTDTTDHSAVAWYASWVAGKTVKYSPDTTQALNILVNKELLFVTYKHIPAGTMEKIAFHSAWAALALEAILHAASIEKGDIWSNITNITANAIDGILIAWPKVKLPPWAHWLGLPGYTLLAGLEGNEGRWAVIDDEDPYIIINMLGDLGEIYLYRRICWTLRESLLSVLTLLNNDAEQAAKKKKQAIHDAHGVPLLLAHAEQAGLMRNNNCFHGTGYLFGELFSMLLPGILARTDIRNYGFKGGGPAAQTWSCGFGGAGIAWVMEWLCGGITARLLAGEWFDNRLSFALMPLRERSIRGMFFSDLWGDGALFSSFWRQVGQDRYPWYTDILGGSGMVILGALGAGSRVADALLYLYFFSDGNTNNGMYTVAPDGVVRRYNGYPATDSSPYRLPWAKDADMQCVQGNMGIWSHFVDNLQIYAYDFSHKEADEVLCSRAGVVRRVDAGQTDHNTTHWNFIEIIHVIVNPASGGIPGVPAPAGVTTYADGTVIPAGTVFPPYPDGFSPQPRKSAGFPAGTTFAFIDPVHDRGILGSSFPADAKYTDTGAALPAKRVFAPNITAPVSTDPDYPEGTSFAVAPEPSGTNYELWQFNPPLAIAAVTYLPMVATYGVYGHGLKDFEGRLFGTIGAVGEFVAQGRAIMEAGDTGVSAYNHLHMQVLAVSASGRSRAPHTIPFVFEKEGVLRPMNYYTSTNTRVP